MVRDVNMLKHEKSITQNLDKEREKNLKQTLDHHTITSH